MCHLGPRMMHPTSQLWIYCKDCFTILHNERGQERHGDYISIYMGIIFLYMGVFLKEILFRAIWLFWNKNDMMSS